MEVIKYHLLFDNIKQSIRAAQLRAALSVNAEMILLYWQIGSSILKQQNTKGWSSKIIPKLAKDLKTEFPDAKGYSEQNLGYMLRFAKEYPKQINFATGCCKITLGTQFIAY